MNIVLLSGGSGKRLWPLSNEVRSKQFLKIFKREDGSRESMVQRMYRMIQEVDAEAIVTIATSENQIPQIRAQLGERVNISVEPYRRDTFPAISLSAAYLKSIGVPEDEVVVICPVDPYVNVDYFHCLLKMESIARKANLTLMGIEPTYPSTKFGYIIPEERASISKVFEFKEKPSVDVAKRYIAEGALWNGGVFACKISYLLEKAKFEFGSDDYKTLYAKYDQFKKISFDYAVVEREQSINVVRFKGEWKDLGTWNSLSEAMVEPSSGKATVDDCSNTLVINELGIPIIALGINNAVVAATPDGILVTDKEKSLNLKKYVGDQRPMYERRFWGEYKVLDYKIHNDGKNSLVKELIIDAGKHISYQKHKHRSEIWTITEGTGELTIDGESKIVKRGDVAIISPEMKHAIKGITELHVIEVQIGDELTEDDIERLEWSWE